MGWSVHIVRPELNRIFKETGRKYRVLHPQQIHQGVLIEYSGDSELPVRFKREISALFPDFVYVDFILADIADEQIKWDNA